MALLQRMPELDRGINLLESDRREAFHRLAVKHLSQEPGKAYWIDARNNASTYTLNGLASRNVLERLEVARAFTAYQHYSIIEKLEGQVGSDTELLLLPFTASLYEDDEVGEEEAEELFRKSLLELGKLSEKNSLTVLLSAPHAENLDYLIKGFADNFIRSRSSSMGLRFESRDFSSRAYIQDGFLQTTWSYWRSKIRERVEVEAVGTY